MELELHRIDLLQTSAAAPSTLVVTAVALGRGQKQRDKIFLAAGNTVRGLTKKGKEFFRFASGLTEAIAHLRVADSHIWSGCSYVHNHFIEGADKGLFMAPDKITATELLPLGPGASHWLPVVACRDCCVRIMGLDGKPLFEVATGSPPTAVRYVADVHGPAAAAAAHSNVRELLYGCQDGRLVQLLVDGSTVRQGFVIPGQSSSGDSGCADIVLGREDGSLEVWDIDRQGQPQLAVASQLSESITSVDGGYITSPASPDIIVHTFTGKVIAFASHPGALAMAAAAEQRALHAMGSMGRPPPQQDLVAALNARIAKENAELAELRAKVVKERERYAANQTASLGAAQAVVDVRHRLTLQPQDGCFVLYVEAAVSLFALALQSTVPLTLLDLPGNVAILSRSPPDTAAGNATLATYRCQELTNRLSIKFTAREGNPGRVTAYTIPALPPKTCFIIEVQLPPLCMHQMVSSIPGAAADAAAEEQQAAAGAANAPLLRKLAQSRPCSEMVLQGSFSVQDVYSWLRSVLPDVPLHMPSGSSSGSLLFQECQPGSMLGCHYTAGQAAFMCESVTTLAILHDSLLAAATAAKERVSISFKLHPAALQHCSELLWPQLEAQRAHARCRKLAAALQELQVQEGGDSSFLAPEYRRMLSGKGGTAAQGGDDTAADQQQQQQQQGSGPRGGSAASSSQADEQLDAAVEAFKQLFRDYSRFASGGQSAGVKQALPGLEKLLRGEDQQGGKGAGLADVFSYMTAVRR
uniref:Bardet-Biedl syndrome 7 n=1 Tax=Tetradesmus obliquus TaxID=3088 RepID=A0A383VGJ7_TETOB|eukprot:jgi/Sobl393_1/4295/SZX63516.1